MYFDNQFLGHVGPGLYLVTFGIVAFIEAVHIHYNKDRRVLAIFIISCIFAPIGFGLEFYIMILRNSMESMNIHHFTQYALIVIDALLIGIFLVYNIYKF